MQITYDREADALGIELLPGARRARTRRLSSGLLLHIGRDEQPVELEILMASTRYPMETLEQIGSPVEWLSLAEAGQEADLAPSTLRKQIHNGRLEATKKGHDWLVSRAALWTYLENRGSRGHPGLKKPPSSREREGRRTKRAATR